MGELLKKERELLDKIPLAGGADICSLVEWYEKHHFDGTSDETFTTNEKAVIVLCYKEYERYYGYKVRLTYKIIQHPRRVQHCVKQCKKGKDRDIFHYKSYRVIDSGWLFQIFNDVEYLYTEIITPDGETITLE